MRDEPRFLIVRLGSLGDVIHAIPAAAALRHRYPAAQIDWLVDPAYVEMLGLVECLDERIPIDTHAIRNSRGRGALLSTLRRLRAGRYDAVFDFQGLIKSAVLARVAGGGRTIGFQASHLREPAARLFYSEMVDPGDAVHVIDKNMAALAAVDVSDRRVRFPVNIPRTAVVQAVLREHGAGRYALVNPGAAWPNKRWPPHRFAAVAVMLQREFGVRPLVLWGPGEEEAASEVVSASEGAAALSPKTTIVDLVGLARDARLMISGDTGPLHVAGAVGTPVVALFGPTYPERNGPWSPSDVTVSRVGECTCRYQRRCTRATRCLDDIAVDEVMTAVRRRLAA